MKTRIYLITACVFFFLTPNAFTFQATITPSISVGEQYSDNHFLTEDNKKEEFITTISPGLALQLLGKTAGLNISYNPEYAKYDEYTENDTWRHRADLNGFADITKNTRLDIRDSFYRTEDPLAEANIAIIRTQDPTVPIDTTIRRDRNLYSTNLAGINLNHQFGEADFFTLGYTHYYLKNEDPLIEDRQRHTPHIGLTYWFVPRWGLELRGDYTKGEFDISDDLDEWQGRTRLIRKFTRHLDGFVQYRHTARNYEGETEDDQTYNPSIGVNYAVAEDISLSVDIGYFINDYKRRDDESGPTGNVSLIKRFKRGSINLSGLGGYDYSDYGSENLGFSVFYEAAGSASYQMTRRISGTIFGSYRNNEYKDIIPEREDKITSAGLGLTFQPLQWISLGLNYTYRSVDSTLGANDYDENRVLARITLTTASPIKVK